MRRWLMRLTGVAGMLCAVALVAEARADQPSESDRAIDLTQPAPPDLTMRPVDLLNANPGGAARGSHRAGISGLSIGSSAGRQRTIRVRAIHRVGSGAAINRWIHDHASDAADPTRGRVHHLGRAS